ncbi:lactonase family protein [Stutzerimonas chloritidismutans]|uniref:lactonase family protein n=1 Tax=Stutzerimonas chloritidismutans TaxID=203192 RepID=UPI003F15F5B4
MYAYVGSRTTRERNARGEGLSVFHFDDQRGVLTPVQVVEGLVNPSYLTLNGKGDMLYCVHGDRFEVSAFRVDKATGRIVFLNRQDTQGKNPVHLALDPDERHLIVSNHIGASLAVLPIEEDGSLGSLKQLVQLDGEPGPHRIEQPHAKPHFNLFDHSGRHVLVPDKGLDTIFCFRYEAGALSTTAVTSVKAREAAGPRHMAFRPQGDMAYVINELDNTVAAYGYDTQTGVLSPRQVLSTLPDSYTGNSRASGIQVDAQGRFLYASNRGFDSIAVFAIDLQTGLLSFVAAIPSQGKTPRYFTLSPDGRYLFALNEDSDSIVTFAVDHQLGLLEATGEQVTTGSPVCMIFSA